MKYFIYLGIGMALVQEFAKAMADGTISKGEWIDIIFNTADKATETLVGVDLDPFRPIAEEIKAQLQAGHASMVGLLAAVATALQTKGIDYEFKLPGA